jgi:membrane-associated phospholipid phosphatase
VLEAGAFLADKPIQRSATTLMNKNQGLTGVSHYVTNFGGLYEGYTLAAFGLYGWVFKNEKVKTTTLLATQAYLVGGAMESVLKFLSGRQRPFVNTPEYPGPNPTFHGPKYSFKENSSFPSGHTTVAFAAATVYAMEYRDRPLVPIIAYSAASLIGFSRITENKHWASDVLAGAALGYVTGRQVVNNYHRYAYLQNHKAVKNQISLGLQYNYNHMEPMIVYHLH